MDPADDEYLKSLLRVFVTHTKRDKTAVLKIFSYKGGHLGFKVTNSAMRQQQQPSTVPSCGFPHQHATNPTTTTPAIRQGVRGQRQDA